MLIFWAFSCLALFLRLIKKKISGKIALWVAFVWLFIISVSPLPQILIYHLEHQHEEFNVQSNRQLQSAHILCLGAGHVHSPELSAANQLSDISLARLIESIRIYKGISQAKLITSGYSHSGRATHAETASLASLALGVPSTDTLMITTPSNTQEEAQHYKKRFGDTYRLILVTSASHMPRAMVYFKLEGLNPIPAPTNFLMKIDPQKYRYDFKPSARKIQMMDVAMHEYLGMLKLKFENL